MNVNFGSSPTSSVMTPDGTMHFFDVDDATLAQQIAEMNLNAKTKNDNAIADYHNRMKTWQQNEDWCLDLGPAYYHLRRTAPPIPTAWGIVYHEGDPRKPYLAQTGAPLVDPPAPPPPKPQVVEGPVVHDVLPPNPATPNILIPGPHDTAKLGALWEPYGPGVGPAYRKTWFPAFGNIGNGTIVYLLVRS